MKRRPLRSVKIKCFYSLSRGLNEEQTVTMIVNGFCKSVFAHLPMEFAVEANRLMAVSLEGCSWITLKKRRLC